MSGEIHELLGKTAVGGIRGPKYMVKTLIKEGHMNLKDIKDNLRDNFEDLGTGWSARNIGFVSIYGFTGGNRYECAFNRGCY